LDHRFAEDAVVPKRWMAGAVGVSLTLLVRPVDAQQLAARVHADRAPDSVRVVANDQYQAGGFHRFVLGDGYRDLWPRRCESRC
jgi:hypothetical protein